MIHHSPISYLAYTTTRRTLLGVENYIAPVGMHDDDRLFHTFLLGRTGSGKSTLMHTLMAQDAARGHGFALLDPHGDLANRVLDSIPRSRINDVIYFNACDLAYPLGFNPLHAVATTQRHLIASTIVSVLKRFWSDSWGPRTEYLLHNAVLALLEAPASTLLDISRILVDDDYRQSVLARVRNPAVTQFWCGEFASYPPAFRQEVVAPLQNKVGQFLLSPILRNIVGQPHNRFQLRPLMDERKILIVNLAKGQLGEDASALLGSMVLTRLVLAALSRSDISEEERRPFFLYADEFMSFGTESTLATLLSETRKQALGAVLATQYLASLSDNLRGAIFGNVGTLIAFRVSREDAEYLAGEFAPDFSAEDIAGLGRYEIYCKLAVNGTPSTPFLATTLCPDPPTVSYREQIISASRERYARPREKVEQIIERSLLPPLASVPVAAPFCNKKSMVFTKRGQRVPATGRSLPWPRVPRA